MKLYTTIILVGVCSVIYFIFVSEIVMPYSFSNVKTSLSQKILTAKGEVDIEEINKNIFEVNGYFLVKNELIPILKKKVPLICENVFKLWQKVIDNGLTIDPPKRIPNPNVFLLNNYTKLSEAYFNETPKNTQQTLEKWNETYVNNLIQIAKENPTHLPRSYGDEACRILILKNKYENLLKDRNNFLSLKHYKQPTIFNLIEIHKSYKIRIEKKPINLLVAVYAATKDFKVKGQVGAVIGSQTPWAEAYILANGAEHVTTIDYYKLSIEHPKMNFLYAPDLPSKKEDYLGQFDFIVSFSSIEHSGLGRYGDPIDPIGDIREMNKIHCMLKPKGLLYLGFPVGVDTIVFNAHRIYGRIRLAMMFEGFKLLKVYRHQSTLSEEKMQEFFYNDAKHDQLLFALEKTE